MNNFKNFLQESFNTKYKWEWSKPDGARHKVAFNDDAGHRVIVVFTNYPATTWSFEFVIDGSTKNTGYRDKKILPTVLNILEDLIRKHDPDKIHFSGGKAEKKGKLYKSMSRHFDRKLKKLGYEVIIDETQKNFTVFDLVKTGK